MHPSFRIRHRCWKGAATAWGVLALLCCPQALRAQAEPCSIPFGGHHEFGVLSGYAPHDGPVFGFDKNVRYSPTVLRYSYLIDTYRLGQLRYAPEVTALSILHENAPSTTNPAAPVTHFGAGFSPEAFQFVFLPTRRMEPFLAEAGGFLYFNGRVLSPQGSQFMYTIDLGGGINTFASPRNAITLGFRYQHLSNANISVHNPGTDAETFYIGFSHFHTKGVR